MAMIIPMEINIFRCTTYVDGAQISPTRDLAVTKDSFLKFHGHTLTAQFPRQTIH